MSLKKPVPERMNITNGTIAEDEVSLTWKVLPCVLLIVGTIGNILSLIVLCRKSLRKSRLTRYLICLSVADMLVLYVGLLPLCIMNLSNYDIVITDVHSFLCKVVPWMLYFSLDMSAWIMVCATTERAMSVWKPLKVKVICTKKISFVCIGLIAVILLVVNGHFLIGFDLIDEEDTALCTTETNSDYERFQEDVFPWVDFVLFSAGPFLLQLVGNTIIVAGIVRGSKTLARYSIQNGGQGGQRDKSVSSMTIMLLFLNAVYLVLTLPICIYFIEDALWKPEDADRVISFQVANFLYYVNNSTNFLAYVISGRRFRKELLSMLSGETPTNTLILSKTSLSQSRNLGSSVSSVYSVSGRVNIG